MKRELDENITGVWLEFKPATIIKGQGICRLIDKGHTNEYCDWENEAQLNMIDVCPIFTALEYWYRDLVHYLQPGYLMEYWNSKQRRELSLNSSSYYIINGVLLRKKYDEVFLRCLEQEYASKFVKELHDGPLGGNFSGDTNTHNILRDGYY